MKPEDIKVERQYNCLKIYFFGILHLKIMTDDLIAVQSWRVDECKHIIEYTFRGGSTASEYDDRLKWETILAALDRYL